MLQPINSNDPRGHAVCHQFLCEDGIWTAAPGPIISTYRMIFPSECVVHICRPREDKLKPCKTWHNINLCFFVQRMDAPDGGIVKKLIAPHLVNHYAAGPNWFRP